VDRHYATSPATQNPYAYALNNPATLTDPTGLYSVMDLLVDLRPAYTCSLAVSASNFSCIGNYLNAIGRYNDLVLEVLKACAIWGTGGFIVGGGWAGAAVGCAAGGGSVLMEDIFGPNPYSECAAWGAAGVRGGVVGFLVGCTTGVVGYYAPDNPLVQCMVWGFGTAAGQTQLKHPQELRGLVGGCISGAASVFPKE